MNETEMMSYLKILETSPEVICTLQLLHVLESTGAPLWFNNGLTEYKWANNDEFIQAEGWVGHDGRWGSGPKRFPMEVCVELPEDQVREFAEEKELRRTVNRLTPEIQNVFTKILIEAKRWDDICVSLDLFSVSKGGSETI